MAYYFSLYSYPTALKMVASGQLDVKPLITHTYELRDSVKVRGVLISEVS